MCIGDNHGTVLEFLFYYEPCLSDLSIYETTSFFCDENKKNTCIKHRN